MAKVSTKHDWDSYWGSKDRAEEIYSNQDRIARNLTHVGFPSDALMLEIGAGTGRDSLPLGGRGAAIYQLDYSYESLRLIQQASNAPGIFPVGGDAFYLPFREDTFDVIFHQGVLEHFREFDADRMLEEQIRVLKRGGLILIDVPQRYHPYTLLKHLFIAFGKWFAGWERSFSYPELNKLLIRHNLKPVHRYGEWMVPSLMYRSVREAGKKIGVRLPLYPPGLPVVGDIRKKFRTMVHKTVFPLYTGISIGIIARKV